VSRLEFDIPVSSAESAQQSVLGEIRNLIDQLTRIETILKAQFARGEAGTNEFNVCGHSLEFILTVRSQILHLVLISESITGVSRLTKALLKKALEKLLKRVLTPHA